VTALVLTALSSSFLTGLVAAVFAQKRTAAEARKLIAEAGSVDAQATQVITDIATNLLRTAVEQSESREASLLDHVRNLEVKVDHLSSVVDALSEQLRAAGLTPAFPKYPPPPAFPGV
jgi:ABC-type bacteriocin/lantibiotic exporter with double-glycine peptidase domain